MTGTVTDTVSRTGLGTGGIAGAAVGGTAACARPRTSPARRLARPSRRLVGVLLVAAACGLVGCAKPKPAGFTVTGRVTKGGEPLPLDPALAKAAAAYVRVGFVRVGDDGATVLSSNSALVAPDGTFAVPRLPAGRYRVTVEHFNGGADDLLKGRFLDTNTPIELQVSADVASFDVDLAAAAKEKRKK